MSICPISFNWKQILEPHVIQVEPSYGEIGVLLDIFLFYLNYCLFFSFSAPKSYALMDVMITGTKPGKIVEEIPCFVEYADEPIYLHVEADIKV